MKMTQRTYVCETKVVTYILYVDHSYLLYLVENTLLVPKLKAYFLTSYRGHSQNFQNLNFYICL